MGRKNKQLESSQSTSHSQSQSEQKCRPYIVWNREMDSALASVLFDQMNQGNESDGDSKPQAYQAAVDHLNSTLHLNLTKENLKNRLKVWKRYYGVVTDVQKQSGFTWDDERKMIIVTTAEMKVWEAYALSNSEARGMQNKVIENWDDIVLLCGSSC
ncbi:L10-interacting MYB domain-containing protein [Actinidia chinensis var. chinensis]|uniref:L10-interacting MYB domain-containing protein n=1 Tax=Actinidia chinensis var. chinensis TaxID=1590841 RepID=A0A2R6S179_ACTCC|nr:L10-interacting MYB domain-containing protein [Actinidia chinensis var. chinensis]